MTESAKPIEKWTGPDKILHFVLIGATPAFIAGLAHGNPLVGVAFGCALGAMKEALDKAVQNSTVSWKDFLVTCAGAAFGGGVSFFF